MTAAHRLALTRLLGLVLLTGLGISQRPPTIGAGGTDPDAFDRVGSRPMPRPDSPGEAMAFRHLQWRNENGRYPDTGLLDAKVHADAMRARGRRLPPGFRAAASPLPLGAASGGATPIDNGFAIGQSAGVSSSGWNWLGPGNVGGRVRALVIDPTNASVMFAGSVGGGIFKTTNGGASWAAADDFMANLAVSTIVMQPGLPGTMYAGTGEGFYNTDGIRGAGVFKSTDSGVTWTQLASTTSSSWWYVNKLAVSPDGAVLLAATRTGIYRSINGGTSWTNTSAIEMTDVTFHPTDSTRAIAGGYAGNVLRSIDGGATWTTPTGLPGGTFTRASVAYARSSPTTIYASIDVNGGSIFRSTNGGASFALVFNGSPDYLGSQGWYGNALWVDPTNASSLIVGGIDLWSSTNGGLSFSQISNWSAAPASAHADQHAIVEQPGYNGTTNKTVWFTNDGGIYGTADVSTVGGGAAPYTAGWSVFNNNLGITQFYGAGGDAATGVMLGGTQDNGTLKYTPATGTTWSTEFGGDGGESAVDPSNSNNLYGEYTYAAIHRSVDSGTTADWINGLFWTGTQYVCKPAPYLIADSCGASQANFIAPFVLDPNTASRLLVGGASLWRTNDATTANTSTTGPTWASIKAPLGAGNFISAIAVADGNADAIWVGHNNGQLFKSMNGTAASPVWTASGAGTLPARFVTRVRVDPTDANTVYVTYGGFSSPNVWKTTDGGSSWTPAAGVGLTGLPSAPVRDIAIRPAQPGSLYAATEIGIFTSEDGGGTWTVPQAGPANVSVEELFWMGPTLVAVTHGRGIFVTTPTGVATTPVITWSTPADIVFGTALSSAQLNATASVPGTFVYSPPAGTILSAGAGQPLSVTFTPADTTSFTIATASVAMTVAKATPAIAWPPPAPISYGTALSAAQLNATSSVPGALSYTPAAGTILDVGTGQTLSVTFTPTDAVDYTIATTSVPINVTAAVPAIDATVSLKPASVVTSWVSPTFSTTATNELVLAFISAGGSSSNTVSGVTGASLTWVRVQRTNTQAGTSEIWRAFAATTLSNASVTATLTTAARGLMTVVTFKNVDTTGTSGSGAIGAIATASPVGTGAPTASLQTTRNNSWVFGVGNDPDSATNRTAGANQTIVDQVIIGSGVSDSHWVQRTNSPTPASLTTVTINDTSPTADHYNLSLVEVLPLAATPTVTWSNPANITYPTALGATQLNATASVPGTFTYTPPSGSVLNAGNNQALAAHFVPTDTIKYASPPDTIVRINVLKRTPTVTWGSPADITYLKALSGTQLNATASVPGTFTYTPASGTVLSAGTNQPLSVHFVPTDTIDYNTPADTVVQINVLKATPAVAWSNPADITYPAALSGTQLNATASVAGTFTYTPAVGVVLNAGNNQALSVHFVPTDTIDYNTPADTVVHINVLKATPTVTWSNPADIIYPAALSGAQLNATADVAGTFTYTPASGAVLTAGAAQTLSVTFTPTDTVNYTGASTTVPITVNKATPTIAWSVPAAITYPAALSATQLNATASAPGSLVYTPPLGTVLNAGAGQTLSVTFTPTDTQNYTGASTTVPITVNKATPTVTWSNPADITYLTPVSGTQLNATASASGTFTYTPPVTTVLGLGTNQPLTVHFVPTDSADYNTPPDTVVRINVLSAAPTITWPPPAPIGYGTALSAAQLNATANVPGAFVYSPPAGTVLSAAAAQPLSVTFTPADATTYTNAAASVAIAVTRATPTVTWSPPVAITYGTALSAAQLNATASVPGTFAYSPPAGTVLSAAAAQPLSVTFTPADATNYTNAIASVAITVVKATPTVIWPPPAAIAYGAALTSAQLNATANVPGTFVYTPPAGTVLAVGAGQLLSTIFTPADTANYTAATASVAITVSLPAPAIDAVVSTDQATAQTSITSPPLSTSADNELVLAFIAADYNSGPNTTVTGVSGAGLTWTLVGRANGQAGTSEIWRAFAVTRRTGIIVTATFSQPVVAMLTVTGVANVDPAGVNGAAAIGATATTGRSSGAPTATLVTTRNNVLVIGVGNDFDRAVARTLGPAQTLVHQYLASVGDTYWVQRALNLTPVAGTSVTLNDTAPTNDRYNFVLAELRPPATDTIAPTVAITAPIAGATVSGNGVVVAAAAADNVAVAVVQFLLDGISLGGEITAPPFTLTWATKTVSNGAHTLSARARDAANNSTTSAPIGVTVSNGVTVTWSTPGNIVYGTALSAAQLNATASVPGTFAYSPAAGTVLQTGAAQTLSVTFTPTDNTLPTAAASVAITVVKATPALTWPAPASVAYGTALSATQLNATANVAGALVYSPAAGTVLPAGSSQPLSVSFTPTDSTNYKAATASVALTVVKGTPTLTWPPPAAIVYGAALSATQLNATANVPGTLVYAPAAGTLLPAGSNQPLTVTFTPADTANYQSASTSVPITVTRAAATLTWPPPATIVYGTALSTTQLKADANVAGTFVYAPAAGTVLPAGSNQPLTVTFTPADTTNYQSASTSVPITVTRAAPVLTWPLPADIVYGTALSATQLNAAANVTGTFEYAPAAGTVLPAGANQPLMVTFTPADTTNYEPAGTSVPITVTRVTPTLTWPLPGDIVYGTALSSTQLNATANVPGAFAYAPAAGTVLLAGGNQPLSVTFLPADATNYQAATATVPITVIRATPTLTWPAPVNIVYGTTLSAAELNATANVAGMFEYAPVAGTLLPAGPNQPLMVTFTPADTTNYQSASTSVPITVTRAMPILTWPPPSDIVYGSALTATQLNATANVPGAFAYAPAAGSVLPAGANQALSATFTPTDTANYQSATASVPITVTRAMPVLTWPPPSDIVYGTALTATQLNATASVPGTFAYAPAAGSVLPAGANQALSATFTPTDTANYQSVTASAPITVTRATPSLTWPSPATIVYGTALSATQLNATANVPGTFIYSPVAGTVLQAGSDQPLSAMFTPADPTNYRSATASVSITVSRATPSLTWPSPATIVYGTALSATQLNATANVAGTFAYAPAAGSILPAGANQPLTATFTPTDTTNYQPAIASVPITVTRANPTLTWPSPATMVYGTALSATQLNATANVPGTFVYAPAAGTVLLIGANQPLSVVFMPTDAINYQTATITVPITVIPAPLMIDAVVSTDQATAQSTISSPPLSTGAANELLLAFIAADYNTGANTTVTGVSGGGLTWTLVGRANGQAGMSEIWRAFAVTPRAGIIATASLSQPAVAMLTVMSIANVDSSGVNGANAIGATAAASKSTGAPSATLVTTRSNAWVVGVGNDYDRAVARTVGAGQTLVHQYLASIGDTYWVQRTLTPTAVAGTSVTLSDTAPTADRYNFFLAEIRPQQ